ncbi:MAG TPA: ROK family protein [Euzebyales bacterium]|nr:ROK family protein [Euzebyales bacterium]
MVLVAGIDVGGTNIEIALVDDDHTVVDRAKDSTPTDGPDAVAARIAELVGQFDDRPSAAGVGIPAPVNHGVVTRPPNLRNWPVEVAFGALLHESLNMPVEVGNDANVGALGEWVAGAGRGSQFMLGVWMGTGVGGGLVLDGRPYTGAFGGAGEFGHMIVHQGGAQCGCGRRGCIEAYAGRASMERFVEVAIAAGRDSAIYEIRDDKGKDRLTSAVWAKALDKGDDLATELVNEAIEAVAVGVGSVINLLDLDRVVIGGGLAEKLGQGLADDIANATARWTFVPRDDRTFVVAELGDDPGVIGAAALGRAAMLLG